MIYRFLFAFLCTLFVTGNMFLFDRRACCHLMSGLWSLSEASLACRFNATIEEVNLFSSRVIFSNVVTRPQSDKEDWVWSAQKVVMTFSWLDAWRCKKICPRLEIHGLRVFSSIENNRISILPHLSCMASSVEGGIPYEVQALTIHNAEFHLRTKNRATSVLLDCSASIHCKSQRDATFAFSIKKMMGSYEGRACIIAGLGTVHGKCSMADATVTNGSISLQLMPAAFQNHGYCTVEGGWQGKDMRVRCRSDDNQFSVDPIIVSLRDGEIHARCEGRFPLNSVVRRLAKIDDVHGSCRFVSLISYHNELTLRGHVLCDDIRYQVGDWYGTGRVAWSGTWPHIRGSAETRLHSLVDLQANWECNATTGVCSGDIQNKSVVKFPFSKTLQATPGSCRFLLNRSANGSVDINYNALFMNVSRKRSLAYSGKLVEKDGIITGEGICNRCFYTGLLDVRNETPLFSLEFFDREKRLVAVCRSNEPVGQQFSGSIDLDFIRSLVKEDNHIDLHAEGKLEFNGQIQDDGKVAVNLNLSDATIRLPQTYNVVTRGACSLLCDRRNKQISIDNLVAGFQSGTIQMYHGILTLGDGGIQCVYLPMVIDGCPMRLDRDIFASFSGSLLYSKRRQALPLLSGSIIIDRSFIHENIFSDTFRQNFVFHSYDDQGIGWYAPLCNFTVHTKEPLTIKTPFLVTKARVSLHVGGSLGTIRPQGTIQLLSGQLNFPYCPLYISSGALTLSPDKPYDPVISLIAKNRVKKHDITLCVSGTLAENDIGLYARPTITDEQIISLLLVGAYDSSLCAMMPAVIMQNVRNIVFGTHQARFLHRHFATLARNISINLLPSFIDQTGRGGLRGAIEIEVCDRLRALIQKNFSLTEDTRFELEYQVSDDITVRGIRDERRDVGGEMEMRWRW